MTDGQPPGTGTSTRPTATSAVGAAVPPASSDTAAPTPHRDAREARKLELEIEELRARFLWERRAGRFLNVLGSVVLVAGFLAGLWQYSDTRTQEFRRRFWEKRLETYSAISTAAARVATLTDDRERAKAFQEFEQLYHGTFILIADDSAALAAKEFNQVYIDFRSDPREEAHLLTAARALTLRSRTALVKASGGMLEDAGLSLY
jgi:hypothetical protein